MSAKVATYAPRGASAVNPRAWGGDFLIFNPVATPAFVEENGAAVVCITGPLVHHATGCFDNYDAIGDRINAAVASDCSRVLLKIDSPGGDVSGCFELARSIRVLSEQKPIIAFIEGQGCSAAYALACSCSAVYSSATSDVGSIGVIECLADTTLQDAALGIRFAFARSGARKGDGNPHLPLDKEMLAARQAHVDALAAIFFGLVAEMRGISPEAVSALEAGVFLGAEAAALKLIDGVTSWSELVSGAIGENGGKPMAKKLTEYLASLAEGEDKEEAKKAKKALAALLAEDDGGEKEAPAKEDASAKVEDKKDEPEAVAAKAEDKDSSKEMKAAAAVTPDMRAMLVDTTRQLHAIKAERAAEKDAKARAAIFATRPDFAPETIAALAAVPTSELQKVIDTYPKIPTAAVAAFVGGTVGDTAGQAGYGQVAPHIEQAIDIKMGLAARAAKIENVGHELHLGPLTPQQAKAHLEKLAANGGK